MHDDSIQDERAAEGENAELCNKFSHNGSHCTLSVKMLTSCVWLCIRQPKLEEKNSYSTGE